MKQSMVMTEQQRAVFAEMLALRLKAAMILDHAQTLAMAHNEPLSWGIGEIHASGAHDSNVMEIVYALYGELRALSRAAVTTTAMT